MTVWTGLVDRYRVTADPLRTQRRIELLVLLLTVFLFLQLGYGAFRLAVFSPPEPVLPAADSLQVKTPLKMDTVTPEQSGEIRNRPLFWPERRPTEVVAIEAAASEAACWTNDGLANSSNVVPPRSFKQVFSLRIRAVRRAQALARPVCVE